MPIIDTHAHLDQLPNLEEALAEAKAAGVESIVAVGESLEANQKNLAISRTTTEPRIYLALGLHPGKVDLTTSEACLDFVSAHVDEAQAIGEIGLDFWYHSVRKNEAQKDAQRLFFRRQLGLAREHRLPAVIHSRGAWRECFEITREEGITQAVFHWYSGPVDVLDDILAAGYFISASPSLAYSPESREALRRTPAERILVETDCPVYYRSPDGNGFAATPKDVWKTCAAVVDLKGIKTEEAVEIVNCNARAFFKLS